MNQQKPGGLAALIEAATFLIGFAMFSTVLVPKGHISEEIDSPWTASLRLAATPAQNGARCGRVG